MTMQNNIDIIRRIFRRNVDESKLQTLSREIDNERPVLVPVAIAANDSEWRPNRLEIEGDRRFTNISQMPNLVRVAGKIDHLRRQLVMGVRQNENAQRIHIGTADGADNADIPSAPRKITRLNPRLALHHVIQ